jgi:hypothetical protein
MTPQKTPIQKELFMGFPGTFARLKSRLRQMAGNQVRYGPNGPGNQASGGAAPFSREKTADRHLKKDIPRQDA